MESMSSKFATMIQILTFSGEITVLENKKVPIRWIGNQSFHGLY